MISVIANRKHKKHHPHANERVGRMAEQPKTIQKAKNQMSVIKIETIAFHHSGEEWKRPRAKKLNPRAFARAKLILPTSTCCFS